MITFQNEMYLLGELKLHEGSVTERKINTTFSGEAHGQPQVDIPMSVHNVNCIFRVGDGVEVTAGNYRGKPAQLLEKKTGVLPSGLLYLKKVCL